MPKKPFEETPYDPIAADLVRDVASAGNAMPVQLVPPGRAFVANVRSNRDIASRSQPQPHSSMVAENSPVIRAPGPTITKRFLLTRSEDEELEAFLLRVQKGAGTKVTLSMFVRAILNVVMQAEEQLLMEVGQGIPRRFPSTHDAIGQGAFEDWWMRCLSNALRTMPRAASSPPRRLI